MNAKWISIGVVGSLFAASHIGMIGMLATRNGSKLPELNMPVGPYTSYVATADEDGYQISYSANDPKTMHITKDIVKPSGFLGFGKSTTQVTEEYVMDGATNQGGPVSNHRSWQDGSAGGVAGISKKSVACIEAVGGGKQTGRLVGTSIGAAAAPAVSGIPFVGWLAAGWIAMFGGEQGSEIGGNMVNDLNDACEVDDGDTNDQD
ncbi:hypothetical protein CPPG_00153 [Cyanophage P-RSM1]|uniref:Uncharacterized protein n=1 Tax=Cyanophage P-RSM1 TaxID=536444 RepID=M4QDY4_9CAUD|nr:hypothetical protein CPPG_00153 [Cyanophage P-RSM1]AGH26469.1 hypothetical protein CPPG_00153 [Cyanophage P-RSM1]